MSTKSTARSPCPPATRRRRLDWSLYYCGTFPRSTTLALPNVYRILWKCGQHPDGVSVKIYETVTFATREAEKSLAARTVPSAVGFDIVWAVSGRVLPDWYRQSALERGL